MRWYSAMKPNRSATIAEVTTTSASGSPDRLHQASDTERLR